MRKCWSSWKRATFQKRLSLIRLMGGGGGVSDLEESLEINCLAFISTKCCCILPGERNWWIFCEKIGEWRIVRKENFPFKREKLFFAFSLFCTLTVYQLPLGGGRPLITCERHGKSFEMTDS